MARCAATRVATLPLVLVMSGLWGCGQPDVPPVYEDFIRLPRSERADTLRTMSATNQLDAYLWSQRVVRPPPMELAWVVAEQGFNVLPSVVTRLDKAGNAADVEAWLAVLSAMSCSADMELSTDTLVTNAVERAVSRVNVNSLMRTYAGRIGGDC